MGKPRNPQAGRPANARIERADGVFRGRLDAPFEFSIAPPSCPAPNADAWDKTMSVSLHVCITCKAGETVADGAACPGTRLHAALAAAGAPEAVTIVPVECLSACSQGCSVALSAPGRWSYVYGRLTENDVPEILLGAAAYAEAADGIVPWRQRPLIFRKQSLARIPPMVLT